MNNKSDITDKLISCGVPVVADVTGAVVGGAVLDLTGSVAASVGVASGVSSVVEKVFAEISVNQGQMIKMEKQRFEKVKRYTVEKIEKNISEGKKLRSDIFDEYDGKRSTATELFEATLIAAQKDAEEDKLKYYSNLVGNTSFSQDDVDKSETFTLIKTAEGLPWGQMCILAFVSQRGRGDSMLGLRKASGTDQKKHAQLQSFLMSQMIELKSKGLIDFDDSSISEAPESLGIVIGSAKIFGAGVPLCKLMELDTVPASELQKIANALTQ